METLIEPAIRGKRRDRDLLLLQQVAAALTDDLIRRGADLRREPTLEEMKELLQTAVREEPAHEWHFE